MDDIIEFLKVLSDQTRMKIIKFLLESDLCVCELVEIISTSQPTVSQHLRRLKNIGLVEERRERQRVIYSLVKPVFKKYMDDLEIFLSSPAGTIPEMREEYERYVRFADTSCAGSR